ncbi:CSC1-like protein At4g02900 isoform X2 [Lycium ferocissimum]|uniref:CSC1-like protein At4g02900 isoform X2 n=1 Tax=Lycium ferocissimum TaxID=112874 RepID=UPI0028157107|nr:CSC1-like protein At4g02900 isoform X2 [Lycium ferocissimum]
MSLQDHRVLYSFRFWAHVAMAYVYTFWTFYILYKEYKTISTMRLHFLSSEKRRPDQFTVLVRNVPPDPDESVNEHVEHFFRVNHPDHYLGHQVVYNANKVAELVEKKKSFHNWLTYYQTKYERNPEKKPKIKTGFWGLWGKSVDAIDHYMTEIEKLTEEEAEEREQVISDPNAIVPAAFVSFKSRWGAAVCAQTQQSRNSTIWLTDWAPEPRDVYWDNLSIPYVQLSVRRLLMAVALFFLTFFFMIPIGFVQAFASIDGIEKALPFLKPLIDMDVIKSFVQGFLPGIVLKIFLILLPMILMIMSKLEGFTSLSSLDRRSAAKYHLFVIVNVFFGSIITGAAFEQLERFLHQSPTEIPKTIGVTLPMKATFFITFIMVDGWAGIAAEILRLVPLVMFHIKNTFLVKTEHDREQAMDPGSLNFSVAEPRLQLYFLLGLVYSVVTPILLPFIIVFFAFAYMVFRHQIINVYDQKYESGASFWPDVNRRILIGLGISQLLLIGLLSTRHASKSTPLLIVLTVLTIWFHKFCKDRFESVFVKLPLQDAVVKDTVERTTEPNFNLKEYLQDAYLHPVLRGIELEILKELDDEENNLLVATKRTSRWSSKTVSNATSEDQKTVSETRLVF